MVCLLPHQPPPMVASLSHTVLHSAHRFSLTHQPLAHARAHLACWVAQLLAKLAHLRAPLAHYSNIQRASPQSSRTERASPPSSHTIVHASSHSLSPVTRLDPLLAHQAPRQVSARLDILARAPYCQLTLCVTHSPTPRQPCSHANTHQSSVLSLAHHARKSYRHARRPQG